MDFCQRTNTHGLKNRNENIAPQLSTAKIGPIYIVTTFWASFSGAQVGQAAEVYSIIKNSICVLV